MKMKKIITIITMALVVSSSQAQSLKPLEAESKVHFVIKNFGIKTGGDFTNLSGSINFNPKDLATASFNVAVASKTVDTDNNARDKHLRKSEYFDIEKYPTISISSTKITESSVAGRFYFTGNVTIKGVTKPIGFGFSATASGADYLFKGSFDINRRDFGVGGKSFSLADKLTVELEVKAVN
jgi:polyisoprenoid-binding protein YceI